MSRLALLACVVLACSCTKSEEPARQAGSPATATTAPEPAHGSAATAPAVSGSGSAGSDSGSAAAGSASASGSAAAGSASASGSGSAGSGAAGGHDEASGSGFDFDKLSYDDQIAFMKTKVMPVMKAEFQKFDKQKYAKFGCKTCHGKEPQKNKYKMPNPELAKLDFAALKAGKQKPEVAKFMAEVVKPKMAEILNQPQMTESNPKGFGCLECHEMKK